MPRPSGRLRAPSRNRTAALGFTKAALLPPELTGRVSWVQLVVLSPVDILFLIVAGRADADVSVHLRHFLYRNEVMFR
jgi:hypothetical protein